MVDIDWARVKLLPVFNKAVWRIKAFPKKKLVSYLSEKDTANSGEDEALVAEAESIATLAILLGSSSCCLRA